MKRKIAGILFALLTLTVASSLVFAAASGQKGGLRPPADAEVNFTAKLHYDSDMDNHVELELKNHGSSEMVISQQAHYIDEIGSAGSWDCCANKDVSIGPQQSERINFQTASAVTHGKNSILCFFFQYGGKWYLGKVGENNGVEFFLQHN